MLILFFNYSSEVYINNLNNKVLLLLVYLNYVIIFNTRREFYKMNIKQELMNLKNKLIGEKNSVERATSEKLECTDLEEKVDAFIDWYYKNIVKGNYTDIGEFQKPNDMRNFIEKMAVWYELRYPDYEINRLMPGSIQEEIVINDVMFRQNLYINEVLDIDSEAKELDWAKFYNAKAFINSLSCNERYLLARPRFYSLVYIERGRSAHLHLTSNGYVQKSEGLGEYTNFKVNDKDLEGMNIKDIVKLLKEKNIAIPNNNELEEAIRNFEKWTYQKEEMLNCVMYRIMERGGNRMGPRRAFLFAKEFGRNIDIPMMYAIDRSDPGLRLFMNEYIKTGGHKDLECYVGYFSRASKKEKMDTISIQELILTQNNDAETFYTPEETALHQRMVNTISNLIDYKDVRKEEIKHSRLQRKLEKSKRTNTNSK